MSPAEVAFRFSSFIYIYMSTYESCLTFQDPYISHCRHLILRSFQESLGMPRKLVVLLTVV